MAISSDGRVHLIKCDLCPTQDGHVSRSVQDFIDAMRRLQWRFYQCEDGTWDSVCPDCSRRAGKEPLKVIELGR